MWINVILRWIFGKGSDTIPLTHLIDKYEDLGVEDLRKFRDSKLELIQRNFTFSLYLMLSGVAGSFWVVHYWVSPAVETHKWVVPFLGAGNFGFLFGLEILATLILFACFMRVMAKMVQTPGMLRGNMNGVMVEYLEAVKKLNGGVRR